MKELIKKIYSKYRKYIILVVIGLCFIIMGVASWKLVFVKYKEFNQAEKDFTAAGKRYFEYRKQLLPKEGEYRQLTLQDLYQNDYIDDLYIPGKKKTCDVNSWIRVFKNKDGEYEYLTYLKCGKFASKVDHEGPKLILNGEEEIIVSLGSEYQELGVKSVEDNKDGKLDIKNVVIDSSKVNMNKIGTYPVTYTIIDSKYNETVVTRNITVMKGLTDIVRSSTPEDNYYKGESNNYVLFSGMLWRIIKANEDGTVKLILYNSVSNLRLNHTEYKDSNVDKWLSNVFYKALHSPKDYLVKTNYCVGDINSMHDYSTYCDKKVERMVALLDIDDYYKTFDGLSTSIFNNKTFALAHKIGNNYADTNFNDEAPDGKKTNILAGIRPVITLNSNMKILSGNGSYETPYKLDDYSYATKKDKLNTRIPGEYVEYSGLVFRIMEVDKNENVKMIMQKGWLINKDSEYLSIKTDKIDKWKFDVKDENNIGYILNNDYLDYIDTKKIITSEYEVPTNDENLTYDKYKTSKVKAKIVLPKTYDLFASAGNMPRMYMFIDSSTNNQSLFAINTSTDKVFELNKTDFVEYNIKAIITLDGNMKIESGKGIYNNPYKIK